MAPDPYDVAELGARLHFAPDEGTLWLDDQRMILMHMSALGVLRRELIERLGRDEARGLLTRVGYSSGTLDSAVAILAEGGEIQVSAQPTPWADRYAIVIDRFGITWKFQFS
jgi:hypothetical protein